MKLKRSFEPYLRAAGYCFWMVLAAGFLAHTADRPLFFNKYDALDAMLVLACLLAALGWRRSLHFFFSVSLLKNYRGRDLPVTPRIKRRIALLLGLALLVLLEIYARARIKTDFTAADYHPYLQNTLAPGTNLCVNSHGFRGEEITRAKPPGTLRIFYLGGSTFLGSRTTFEKTHPRLLEKQWQATCTNLHIEVQNAANHWHTTEHSIIKYLFTIADFNPDIMVICHNINDIYRSFSPPDFARQGYEHDYSHFYGPVARMVEAYFKQPPLVRIHSQLVRRVMELYGSRLFSDFRRPRPVEQANLLSRDDFRRNLTRLTRLLKADGVRVFLATEPSIYRHDLSREEEQALWMNKRFCRVTPGTYLGAGAMADAMTAYNTDIKAIAEQEQAPLIDLDAAIPRSLEYFHDDCHYTEKGHEAVARIISDQLLASGALKNTAPGK
ncbi:MAG: SGNH/GDSL hydrolase family protein [Spartobacteria bacterium]|nr:SGNH/GDSL hydrolase family protein [Spartobacteria bacterium]